MKLPKRLLPGHTTVGGSLATGCSGGSLAVDGDQDDLKEE